MLDISQARLLSMTGSSLDVYSYKADEEFVRAMIRYGRSSLRMPLLPLAVEPLLDIFSSPPSDCCRIA